MAACGGCPRPHLLPDEREHGRLLGGAQADAIQGAVALAPAGDAHGGFVRQAQPRAALWGEITRLGRCILVTFYSPSFPDLGCPPPFHQLKHRASPPAHSDSLGPGVLLGFKAAWGAACITSRTGGDTSDTAGTMGAFVGSAAALLGVFSSRGPAPVPQGRTAVRAGCGACRAPAAWSASRAAFLQASSSSHHPLAAISLETGCVAINSEVLRRSQPVFAVFWRRTHFSLPLSPLPPPRRFDHCQMPAPGSPARLPGAPARGGFCSSLHGILQTHGHLKACEYLYLLPTPWQAPPPFGMTRSDCQPMPSAAPNKRLTLPHVLEGLSTVKSVSGTLILLMLLISLSSASHLQQLWPGAAKLAQGPPRGTGVSGPPRPPLGGHRGCPKQSWGTAGCRAGLLSGLPSLIPLSAVSRLPESCIQASLAGGTSTSRASPSLLPPHSPSLCPPALHTVNSERFWQHFWEQRDVCCSLPLPSRAGAPAPAPALSTPQPHTSRQSRPEAQGGFKWHLQGRHQAHPCPSAWRAPSQSLKTGKFNILAAWKQDPGGKGGLLGCGAVRLSLRVP